jgi:hypothetical protein
MTILETYGIKMDIALQRTEVFKDIDVTLSLRGNVTFSYECPHCKGIPSQNFGELPCNKCDNSGRLCESHTLASFRERVTDSNYTLVMENLQQLFS